MKYTTKFLIEMVQKTHDIDESGDANFMTFLEENWQNVPSSLNAILVAFLIWANGPKWDGWLQTAQVGDIPPKEEV